MRSPAALIDTAVSEERLTVELKELLMDKLAIHVDSSHQDLFETGVLDSTNMVRLLLHLEERYGLRLAIEKVGADSFRSLNSIASLVSVRLNGELDSLAPVVLMETEDTVAVIRTLFLEKMNIRIESVTADLFQTGVFDSMTLVEFILHLEEHFGLRFPMQDLELDSVLSVEKLAELVAGGRRAAAVGARQ